MPYFKYEAYNQSGSKVAGSLVASSKQSAMRELEQGGLFIASVQEQISATILRKKVPQKSFSRFNKEMIALTRAGVPLLDALSMCSTRPNEPYLTGLLNQAKTKVANGERYSSSCESFPEVFDSFYVAAMRTGEHSGDLLKAMRRYQSYLDRKMRVSKEIRNALYYPLFLLSALILVLILLFTFVVPSFAELYESFEAELPFATRAVLALADIVPAVILVLGLCMGAAIGVLRLVDIPNETKVFVDRVILKLPVWGKFRQNVQRSRIMMLLGSLLDAGSSLTNSIQILAMSSRGLNVELSLQKVQQDIENGERFADSVSRHSLLDEQMAGMLASGEKSGSLAQMMDEVSTYLDETVEEQLKAITSLFEPIIMVFLGVLVGIVLIAMYLPIFFMAEVVQ